MGLELVQIVMDVEQTFAVRLHGPDVPVIRTVGQLHDCIAKALRERPDPAKLDSLVCEKVCRALESAGGLSPQQVQPTTPLRDIMPIFARRTNLAACWEGIA